MSYVEIQFPELENFLVERGFFRVDKVPNSHEIGFAKMYEQEKLMIFILTGFEQIAHQRAYGEDAIRCQLFSIVNKSSPIMDLAATKRLENWESTLGKKISLLESLIKTAELCPVCHSQMVVIHGKFNDPVLWVCSNFKRKDCKGKRFIEPELQKEIAAVWPKYHE